MIGKTLAHYEITGELGKGGMGEVYRARDTRLGRTVAIKVLPSELSARAEVKERFEREARMISSLSHPHVCALYDVGHDDGVDYLVMEYLEGETLVDRLARSGALALENAVRVGIQIADALAGAHRLGIVHRDLKPGNVMLTPAGVKLLDFGLAKAAEVRAKSDAGLTAMQTEAAERPLTQEGTILGTLQYMSPEQLEGKEADARSDIFALGLVLYEMISGKRAFEGDSQASLIAAIMSAEPASISDLAPMTPPALERLVKACLAKDPDRRIQSAHDVGLQLEWIAHAAGGSDAVLQDAPQTRSGLAGGRLGWIVAVILAVAVVWSTTNRVGDSQSAARTTRLSVLAPAGLRVVTEPPDFAVSPDGYHIAFLATDSTGTRTLWVRTLDSLDPIQVPGSDGGRSPFWSPDSRNIGFFRGGQLVRVAPFGSRATQVICEATSGRGGSWSENDVIVFAPVSSGPIYSVAASGGTPSQVTVLDESRGETAHRFPQFLPGGRLFLYVALGPEMPETQLASLDGDAATTLLAASGMATYVNPGYLIYEEQNALLAVRFDMRARSVRGAPFALVDAAGGTRNYAGSMAVSASRNATIVYVRGETEHELYWVDRQGQRLETIAIPPGRYKNPSISPDGTRIAVVRPNDQNEDDVWLIELERNVLSRLAFDAVDSSDPRWSHDGRHIAFSARDGGTANIYAKRDGGSTELLTRMEGTFARPMAWSADGKAVLIRQLEAETKDDILIYSLESQQLEPLVKTPFNERAPSISRSGEWVAYWSNESGDAEIYVQPFPGLESKMQVSVGGAGEQGSTNRFTRILWGPNDQEIVYLGADGRTLMRVDVVTEPAFRVGRPEPLLRLPDGFVAYDSIDLQRFLVCTRKNAIQQFTVVTNWSAELTER